MPSQLLQSTREEVLDAYGRECIFCGTTESENKNEHGRSLDVHHLIPKRSGGSNDPENLVPLCVSCHNTMESVHGKAMKELAKEKGLNQSTSEEHDKLEEKYEETKEEMKKARGARMSAEAENDRLRESLKELLKHKTKINIHVVHETHVTTSRVLYAGTDEQTAYEKYESAEYHVTMETVSIRTDNLATIIDPLSLDPDNIHKWLSESEEETLMEYESEPEDADD